MIITKEGITLASDLAITNPNNKSYNCGDKIFKITDEFPIGIMINGNVDFEEVPLETLIGEFTKTIDFKNLKSVESVKNGFLEYLSSNTNHTPVDEYISWVLDDFKKELIEEIDEYGFDEALKYYTSSELNPMVENYENFKNEFDDIIPCDKDKSEYNLKLWKIFSHQLSYEGTGMIFAGFNAGEFYPTFFEINLHCNDNGKIIYEEVDFEINTKEPLIKVFAINEEAYTFITGASDNLKEYIEYYIEKSNETFLLELAEKLHEEKYNDEQLKEILTISEKLIDKTYSKISQTIKNYKLNALNEASESADYLPKMIIWDLADYLIKLTALKQKLSSDYETISSETEIAFINKTHNFKWVKNDNETFKYK